MQEAASMTYYRVIQGGEDEILETVAEQGPVLVSIDHRTRTFMFYSSGIYNNHMCSTYYSELTHEMVVVGYGPTNPNSTPYWILKNSYGTGWGIDGYMHMVRDRNTCGIAVDAAHPIV
jgi:C1A family cysteine protease